MSDLTLRAALAEATEVRARNTEAKRQRFLRIATTDPVPAGVLARRLGVSSSTVANWCAEQGITLPTVEHWRAEENTSGLSRRRKLVDRRKTR